MAHTNAISCCSTFFSTLFQICFRVRSSHKTKLINFHKTKLETTLQKKKKSKEGTDNLGEKTNITRIAQAILKIKNAQKCL